MLSALFALAISAAAADRLDLGGADDLDVLDTGDVERPDDVERPTAEIWNGREDRDAALDAVVALQVGGSHGSTAQTFCSGTLIHPEWVLTAAHCLDELDGWRRDGWAPSAGIGAVEEGRTRIPLDGWWAHPGYDPDAAPGTTTDLGLVHLSRPVTDRAPLPLVGTAVADDWVGLPISVVGYGVTASDRDDDAGTRRVADLFLVGVEGDFLRLFNGSAAWDVAGGQFVETEWDSSSNACFGDSGGAAVTRVDGRWALVGVTSVVYPTCEHGGTGALRVDDVRDWIAARVPLQASVALPPAAEVRGDDAWPAPPPTTASPSPSNLDSAYATAIPSCSTTGGSGGGLALIAALVLARRRRSDPAKASCNAGRRD